VGGWMEVKAVLRIAYSNQKLFLQLIKNFDQTSLVQGDIKKVNFH
jgi:hypothetical protein